MKKIEDKNKKYFQNTESNLFKKFIQNPKKLFRKNLSEKRISNTTLNSLYYDKKNSFLNDSKNKYDFRENKIVDTYTDRVFSPKKTINSYLSKIYKNNNGSKTDRNTFNHLPKLTKQSKYDTINDKSGSNSLKNFEIERLNQEKYHLNKLIKSLKKELFLIRKNTQEKDEILSNKEKEITDIINTTDFQSKEYFPTTYNNTLQFFDENIQNKNSYNLYLKIKKEIKNCNNEMDLEQEKINELKHSIYYTKMNEIKSEYNLLEQNINKISSLIEIAYKTKENNAKGLEQYYDLEQKINVQNKLLMESKQKQKRLNEEKEKLDKEIKSIKINLASEEEKINKNKKELKFLMTKNNNLSKDEVIKTHIYIKTDDNNSIALKALYLNKISKLKKNVSFYKNQNNCNELNLKKLKEQKKSFLESIKLNSNINYNTKFLSLMQKHIIENENKNKNSVIISNKEKDKNKDKDEEKKDDKNNFNNNKQNLETIGNEQKIIKLRKKYLKLKSYEKFIEEKYFNYKERMEQILEYYNQQNIYNENNNYINIQDEKGQNEIEFGIDTNNPYYTENEENQPEINNKFTSTQFNHFTYILFKNFEAKGIVSDEAKDKIINPFTKFANDNELTMIEYPSDNFNLITEEYTKIILNSINSENNYNHTLTKIFISALLINSGCSVQKLIQYFNILYSYTKNYMVNEEKFLSKLRNKYKEQVKQLYLCINNYLKQKWKDKNYQNFPVYFPLIKLKELIELNNINIKDKYVEFLFYYLKKYNDNEAKLDDLKYNLLKDLLEENINDGKDEDKYLDKLNDKNSNKNKIIQDDKNEENKEVRNNEIIEELNESKDNKDKKDSNKDKNITEERIKDNYSSKEDSITEITNEEYIKNINDSINLIKKGLDKNKTNFNELIKNVIKNTKVDNNRVEYITIDDFNTKLREIDVLLSDLQLSCLCNKYSIPNDLRLLNLKNLEDDINPK